MRLERLSELLAEARELLAHRGVVAREHRRALRRCGEQRAGLARRHDAVALRGDVGARLEADVEELSLAHADAGLVREIREVEDAFRREATSPQALHGEPGDRVHAVSGVDRLRHAPDGPHRGAMVPRRVLVLDVVVDEREVVQQLDRRGRGQDTLRLIRARQGLEHQKAEQGTEALATARPAGIQAEVVQHHAVEGLQRRLGLRQQRADLLIDRGDTCLERRLPRVRSHRVR